MASSRSCGINVATVVGPHGGAEFEWHVPHVLPPLPYPAHALAPHLTRLAVAVHHDTYHRTYVEDVNRLVAATDMAALSLEEIVTAAAGRVERADLLHSAAEAWNHAFFWRSMRPGGGGRPAGELMRRIESTFGRMETFAHDFLAATMDHVGSGWAWLLLDGERLSVQTTANADTPLAHGATPLLALDLWEHAYDRDYRNRRLDYVTAWLAFLVDWDFAAGNLVRALGA